MGAQILELWVNGQDGLDARPGRGEARPRRRAFIFSAMRPQLNRPVESSRDDEALVRHEVSRHDLARVPEHGSQETVVPRPPQLERGIK